MIVNTLNMVCDNQVTKMVSIYSLELALICVMMIISYSFTFLFSYSFNESNYK